ncbi:unnamed protein product [Dovyalis caffra]|uniref:Uncharacterized protein n=1 Tax=Dovyalis caffra TaxID=77055 RepID=A0AAV1QN38_9ROSI|nr:unnamed protein product [Dovyalis caffra]
MAALSHDHDRPDLESIRAIVDSINEFISGFLANVESWNSLKSQCISKLNITHKQEFFEFSEHRVLSNLYWGIESIEAAIQAKCPEGKTRELRNLERLLQVLALLDEHAATAGIQNQFLVCCSYFYLSVVKKLQNDELQVALHYLHPMLVSPRLVRTEFALEFCRTLFPPSTKSKIKDESAWDFSEDNTDEAIRHIARRYKHWLMYYQIMLCGETSQWHCRSRNTSHPDDESQHLLHVVKGSSDLSSSIKHEHCLHNYHKYEMVRPLDLQEIRIEGTAGEPMSSGDIQKFQYYSKNLKHLDRVPKVNIKQLQEILMEGESDSPTSEEASELNLNDFSGRFLSCISDFDLRVLEFRDKRSDIQWNSQSHAANSAQRLHNAQIDQHGRSIKKIPGDIEKAISKICFSEGLAKFEEDYAGEVSTVYEMLNNKRGVKVIRASVSILTTIISTNKSAIEDIKKKGLRLCDLATALKRNVHEAAILIHLINSSPTEMKTLELLPTLVEVVCSSKSYKEKPATPLLTPHTASLMIIEVSVTAFDCATNSMHLAAINSPCVLCELLNVAGNKYQEGYASLANVLVKCMHNEKRAKFAALEFFHELLRMPRYEFQFDYLHNMKTSNELIAANTNRRKHQNYGVLVYCVRELQPDYQLLAANLLLQLDTLENSSGKSSVKDDAIQIILKLMDSRISSPTQELSTFILANLGGTYAWTGESYTVAWLVKKAGLTSLCHQNMIRNFVTGWIKTCR